MNVTAMKDGWTDGEYASTLVLNGVVVSQVVKQWPPHLRGRLMFNAFDNRKDSTNGAPEFIGQYSNLQDAKVGAEFFGVLTKLKPELKPDP